MPFTTTAAVAALGFLWIFPSIPAAAGETAEAADGSVVRSTAAELPGFAGAWLDGNGTGHILLTDPEQFDHAHRALARADAAFKGPAVAESAGFTYSQLEDWHSRIGSVQSIEGVVYTDIEERRNRVVVGAVDAAALEHEVREIAADQGIPNDAVVVLDAAPIVVAPGRVVPSLPLVVATAVLGFVTTIGAGIVVYRRINMQSQVGIDVDPPLFHRGAPNVVTRGRVRHSRGSD